MNGYIGNSTSLIINSPNSQTKTAANLFEFMTLLVKIISTPTSIHIVFFVFLIMYLIFLRYWLLALGISFTPIFPIMFNFYLPLFDTGFLGGALFIHLTLIISLLCIPYSYFTGPYRKEPYGFIIYSFIVLAILTIHRFTSFYSLNDQIEIINSIYSVILIILSIYIRNHLTANNPKSADSSPNAMDL